ncbi:MAG: phage holin family protein [Actinobacteria bacterium]|nr:phage holin family protein [Actinomycetota bacterium]
MAEPATAHLSGNGSKQSVGELVSLAIADLTRLIRCEVQLAKVELRADARRVAVAAALTGIAAFAGVLVLVMLCFAFAYGLIRVGIWDWAAFLIVAGTCVVLAGLAMAVVAVKMRRMSGLRRTRATMHDDLALLRREEQRGEEQRPGELGRGEVGRGELGRGEKPAAAAIPGPG